MLSSYSVLSDLAILRSELAKQRIDLKVVCRPNPWRPALDIAVDWLTILLAITACYRLNYLVYPLGIAIIANRQRALGNLLHDAAHENLYRKKFINDLVASALLAPALLSDLGCYRDLHFRHHANLGKPRHDPDLIQRPAATQNIWRKVFLREAFSVVKIASSVVGHVGYADLGWRRRAGIVLWWIAVFQFASLCAGTNFALLFVVLWFTARATIFHWITAFREMCDHFDLDDGGIYSFTRDIVSDSPWRWIIHPRNNAYHLTHHLLPWVPYYRLPCAQKICSTLQSYVKRGIVCTSYFSGDASVIHHRIAETRFKCRSV